MKLWKKLKKKITISSLSLFSDTEFTLEHLKTLSLVAQLLQQKIQPVKYAVSFIHSHRNLQQEIQKIILNIFVTLEICSCQTPAALLTPC